MSNNNANICYNITVTNLRLGKHQAGHCSQSCPPKFLQSLQLEFSLGPHPDTGSGNCCSVGSNENVCWQKWKYEKN